MKLLVDSFFSIPPLLQGTLLKRHFSPKLSAKIAKDIEKGEIDLQNGQRYHNLIFVKADLKNFTKLVDSTRDYIIIKSLMELYYKRIRKTIFRYEGMFDKFIGDAVIAVFGLPYYEADHTPTYALSCAREIITVGYDIEQNWLSHIDVSPPEIGVRVGIAFGDGVMIRAGNEAEDLVMISNELNLAQRLESEAPINGIRISNRFYNLLGKPKHFRKEDLKIKGFSKKIVTWMEENSLKYI